MDTAEDQKYFDKAAEEREESRRRLTEAPGAALHRGGADALRRQAKNNLTRLGGPNDPVAFGRIDLEDETRYIGTHAIWDHNVDPLVINWQMPAAEPYYLASPKDPAGVKRKRTFTCDGNQILSLEEVIYEQLSNEVARLEGTRVDDALLEDLGRHRGGEMANIVKTIQAAQYDLLRASPDQLLIIEGGPGTGKTAVGLHRVSWLLFNHRDQIQPSDVLVIGPNRTFVRYIRQVLPDLGDAEVVQVHLNELGSVPRVGRDEAEEVAHLKGDLRMKGLLRRALDNRVRQPEDDITITAAGSTVRIPVSRVVGEIERMARFAYAEGRTQFRRFIRSEVAGRLSRDTRPFEDEISRVTDRVWPAMTAETLLQDLYGSRTRLVAAAGHEFTGSDIENLHRQAASRVTQERWSEADVAVLDCAAHLIDPKKVVTYGHIVVDEAQDLSPMQADMIARRSQNGSMTILGDIYQSTGPWARDSWDDLIDVLGAERDIAVTTRTLRYGYRVPTQVYELAVQVLHKSEPDAAVPDAVRKGPSTPEAVRRDPDELAAEAVARARKYAADGCSVGVLCPDAHWDAVTRELTDLDVRWTDTSAGDLSGSINVVRPELAKGLEFDAVVVVDPAVISRSHDRGRRLLYVAMTRTTTHLTLVFPTEEEGAGDRFDQGSNGDPEAPSPDHDAVSPTGGEENFEDPAPVDEESGNVIDTGPPDPLVPERLPRVVETVAEMIAQDLRDLRREHWSLALRRAAELLEVDLDEAVWDDAAGSTASDPA